jgi:hypothetical protein
LELHGKWIHTLEENASRIFRARAEDQGGPADARREQKFVQVIKFSRPSTYLYG